MRSMVEEKNVREEDVGQSLRLLVCDLLNKEKPDPDTKEQLLLCLAGRYFLLLELINFAVKVVVSMKRYQLVATFMSRGSCAGTF